MITVTRHGSVLAASDASGEIVALTDGIDDEAVKANADWFGEVIANNQRQQWARIAILDHRAQERQAKAAATHERAAGVQALLDEAGYPPEFMNAEDEAEAGEARAVGQLAAALYDAGHRAKSTAPAEPRPFQVGDVVRISDNARNSITRLSPRIVMEHGLDGWIVTEPPESWAVPGSLVDEAGDIWVKRATDEAGRPPTAVREQDATLVAPAAKS